MKLQTILSEISRQRLTEKKYSKDLIVVDIQPAYESSFRYFTSKFVDYLNDNEFTNIIYLYNGPDMGYESESDIISWLYENGVEEDILDQMTFFEKGYGFFRSAMDSDILEDEIIRVLQFMIKNNYNDARDINPDEWDELDAESMQELVDSGDIIYLPDDYLIKMMSRSKTPILIGGGQYECLAEIEILMQTINKKYKLNRDLIY